jgi:hypothetical protein
MGDAMTIYLASPNTQQQAEHACGMPVLLSFAIAGGKKGEWIEKGYQQSFSRILIDSGAFSELTSKAKVDLGEYREWSSRWVGHADAIAGLDDISGNWRRSLANYEAVPVGFPTFHETDPHELLDDLIPMARERGRWIGLGMLPATRAKRGGEGWLSDSLSRIPADVHVHLWAGRGYLHHRRVDSADSTNWWRDALQLRAVRQLEHLTYGECLEIVVKRYQRESRSLAVDSLATPMLWEPTP